MPAKPRSHVFDPDTVGVYHCSNQLVRQRFLFGFDSLTNTDYGHRKEWVRDRFRELAGCMAVDVLDYAILDNHLHLVLRNRPDIVSTWTDHEVACRWWRVCPKRRNNDGSAADPLPSEIAILLRKVEEYRRRLSDISWMMRLACQPIAVRANREDGVEGRFFAKRFECRRLESEADILGCSLYVDLNVIRAGAAQTPETSKFTSVYDRIQGRWQEISADMSGRGGNDSFRRDDDWLAPVFLDERGESYPSLVEQERRYPRCPTSDGAAVETCCSENAGNSTRSAPARLSNKGFLPLTRDQYISLVDRMGRLLRSGKRGAIPADLPPILERLGLNSQAWFDSFFEQLFVPLGARAHPTAAL